MHASSKKQKTLLNISLLPLVSQRCSSTAGAPTQASGIAATTVGIQCALQDPELQSQLIQWCQLVCAWLVHVATGTTPGQVTLPLSDTPPRAFRMIPEYVVSDMATLLMLTTVGPDDMGRMDDVILACTALMGSPSHVTNPYLRYTLCTVLHQWIPDSASSSRRRYDVVLPTHPSPQSAMTCAARVPAVPAHAAFHPRHGVLVAALPLSQTHPRLCSLARTLVTAGGWNPILTTLTS